MAGLPCRTTSPRDARIPPHPAPASEHLVQQLRSLQYLLSELRPALVEFVRLGIPRHTQLQAIPMVCDRIKESRKIAMKAYLV